MNRFPSLKPIARQLATVTATTPHSPSPQPLLPTGKAQIRSQIGLQERASITNIASAGHQFFRTRDQPHTAISGKGIYLTLADGTLVLDAVGGAAVNCIGHGVVQVEEAIKKQLSQLAYVYGHSFNTYPGEELADYVINLSRGAFEKAFFVAGGSEANESMIKLARQYWVQQGQTQRTKIIGRQISYHGNTLGALAAGHHPSRRALFEPIIQQESFRHVSPANYKHYSLPGETEEEMSKRLANELEEMIVGWGGGDQVAMFIAEPMSGTAQGCTTAPKGYWPLIRQVCDKYGVLLAFDEVMCGSWRSGGDFFAFRQLCEGVTPDLLVCAKGLGSGYVPIGAVLANERVARGLDAEGDSKSTAGLVQNGFTYTAHPISCAGSLAVQKYMAENNIGLRVNPLGERLVSRLCSLFSKTPLAPYVIDIRGSGLFWAIEFASQSDAAARHGVETTLTKDGKWLKDGIVNRIAGKAMEMGVITMAIGGTVDGKTGQALILAPPYVCTDEEIDVIADVVVEASVQVYNLEGSL